MSVAITERVLPNNLDAERSVLGAILIDGRAWATAAAVVSARDFFRDAHARIFRALTALAERPAPMDLVLLREELARAGEVEEVGGPAYISSLVEGVPKAVNVEYYARVVREKARLRAAIFAGNRVIADAYDGDLSASEVVDVGVRALLDAAASEDGRARSIGEAVRGFMESLDAEHGARIPSGLSDLDTLVGGGFERRRLTIVAARPGVGKTSLALSAADHASAAHVPAAIISLEMEPEALAGNLLSSRSAVDNQRMRRKLLNQSDWARITEARDALDEQPLYLVSAVSTLTQAAAWTKRLHETHGVELVFLDYLQLLGDPAARDRQQEVAVLSRGLKRLAQTEDVAVVALSQLSREPERRRDKRPQLADLRESGALEADADLVLLLFREEQYKPTVENRGVGEIIVAKNRGGPVGTVKAAFLAETARWRNLALV